MTIPELLETEVLIIGCGIAGGIAAYALAKAGVPVTVVTRADSMEESNTLYAQGGIIYQPEEDSVELLKEDVTRAGAGHCRKESVDILSKQGPELVESLLIDQIGVKFDRSDSGELLFAREAGHSVSRIIHAADATGRAIETALIKALESQPNIQLMKGFTAIDLLTPSHHSLNHLAVYEPRSCIGAYLLNQSDNQVIRCIAKKTILATGGLGQIFLRTSNPEGARGDGLAMAYRAGARVINTEFIQFHPTVFHKTGAPHFLISEAIRGAGAKLVHADGNPFMEQYNSEWKDLAPRDIVARSIHQEMLKKDLPNVFLDLHSYVDKKQLDEHFPNIQKHCMNYGVNISKNLVPVVPAAHYACGGVWVDDWGQSALQNLYAVGEVACTGVHGANRLASASILEGLVWGQRAANHIADSIADQYPTKASDIPPWSNSENEFESPDLALIAQDISQIKHIMWNYVGLVRSGTRLQRAIRELRHLEAEIERFYRVSRLTDSLIGLRNSVRTAIVVSSAAWENKTSMGCHYRI